MELVVRSGLTVSQNSLSRVSVFTFGFQLELLPLLSDRVDGHAGVGADVVRPRIENGETEKIPASHKRDPIPGVLQKSCSAEPSNI